MPTIKIKISAIDASLLGGNPAVRFFEKLSSTNTDDTYWALQQKVDDIIRNTTNNVVDKKLMDLIEKEITVYETAAINLHSGDVITANMIITNHNHSPAANQIVSVLRSMGWSFVLNYKKWVDYDKVVLYFEVCREENEYELVLKVKKGMEL